MCSSSRDAGGRLPEAMVADSLAWRQYGDDVIAADVAGRVSHVLRGRASSVFLAIAEGHAEDPMATADDVDAGGTIRELVKRRILQLPGASGSDPAPPVAIDAPAATETVLFAWATRNRIPLSGSLEITEACNLSCRHCYCTPARTHALDTLQLTKVIDSMAAGGALYLTITGGEVFLRPDWREILRHLDDTHFSFRINTNGVLLDESAVSDLGELKRLREVHVSVYSADPAIHDAVTGVKGSHRRSVKALEMLLAAGIPVSINCSVMRTNLDSFDAVKRMIGDRLGIGVRYDPRIVLRHDGTRSNIDERLSTTELRRYYEGRLADDLSEDEFVNPKRRSAGQGSPCSAGSSYFAVAADATLYPCFQLRIAVGNLLDSSLADLWRYGSALETVRETSLCVPSRCATCVRLPCCNLCIGMGQSENGDPLSPADENCRDSAVRMDLAVQRGILPINVVPQGGQAK